MFRHSYLHFARGCAVVLIWTLNLCGAEASGGAFRVGDRWAAVGDSITHSGSYHAWVNLYYLTRFPTRPLEVVNCGIAGDTAAGGVRRFAWDIQPVQASVATGGLRRVESGLSFSWTAHALPFPNDPSFGEAMRWVPFAAELNQETLRITALPEATYALRIDGADVGRYSAEVLARGLNLAENPLTPQYRQAIEVLRLVQQQRLHVTETARNIALVEHQCAPAEKQPYTLESAQSYYAPRLAQLIESQPPTSNLLRIYKLYPEIKPRDVEDRALARKLAEDARRAAQPKPHVYEVVRVQ